jgi:hypothetical protein
VSLLHRHIRHFNIVIDTIKYRSLVDDHCIQLFENCGESEDRGRDLVDFLLALGYECIVVGNDCKLCVREYLNQVKVLRPGPRRLRQLYGMLWRRCLVPAFAVLSQAELLFK